MLGVDLYYNDNINNIKIHPIIIKKGKELFKDNYEYFLTNECLNDIKNNIIGDNEFVIISLNDLRIKYYFNKLIDTKEIKPFFLETGNTKEYAIYDIRDYLLQGAQVKFINNCKLKNIINFIY